MNTPQLVDRDSGVNFIKNLDLYTLRHLLGNSYIFNRCNL